MIKPVSGFQSFDGMFFDTLEAAELHEAEMRLIGSAFVLSIDPDRLMGVIHVLYKEIERYITACRNSAEAGGERRLTTYANERHGEHAAGEEGPQAKLEFTADGDSDVSDLGDSELAASMAIEGKSDGVRGRGSDASSIRGSSSVAIEARSGIGETRASDSEPFVWGEALAEVSKSNKRGPEDGGI